MEIEITEEEDNELLNRKEVRFSVVHDGETPERLAVRDSLAAKLDKGSDEVVVHRMDTKFGMNQTLGRAKVYESADSAREIEEEYMLERNKIDEEAVGGEGDEGDEETEDAEETEDEGADAEADPDEGAEETEGDGADEAEDETEGDDG